MIRLILGIAVLCAVVPSFAQQNVKIQVGAAGAADPAVVISLPVDGNYFEPNTITKTLDANNKVLFTVPLNTGGVVKVSNDFRSVFLVVQAGEKYELTFVPGKKAVQIKGNNATGQELYNTLFEDNTRSRFQDLDKYPLAAKRLQVCDSLKKADLQKFEALLSDKKINTTFYRYMETEADMYYRLLFSTDMFFSLRSGVYSETADTKNPPDPEFVKAWTAVYADVNSNKNWLRSQFFSMLMGRYSSLQHLKDKSPKEKDIPYALQMIRDFKVLLKGDALEYAWANGIATGLGNNENEKVWLSNWAEFKQTFPKSKLRNALIPGMQKVEAYHKSLLATPKEVVFLKDYAQISSLEELGQRLKGSVSYVDMWATWCGPCKLELQYSIKLHEELEKLGVKPVYLSIDRDNADAKWQEMVKGFPLKGINLRSGTALKKDIDAKVPKFVGIPRYLIFNSKGEIVNWDAKRPSDMKVLLEQLKEIQ
ncbi:thiol-disulfide isomerase/thioredoxin [Pedobacter africanus]|uniref:Thiol-disulfide isomerase/thioredoxin n=1 Tax=Pedobacter africanus TaxID=151894 RepID=A0ACC6L572_9SPHI|nr:TlpA disulfide reductase family protein [Pedobacter africanus]MDR6786509.1 thiol-disulfide isomerase/thioredoxin [Pedobacter africanus]